MTAPAGQRAVAVRLVAAVLALGAAAADVGIAALLVASMLR